MEILLLEAAGERFALPAAEVRQVLRAVAVAALPGAPPAIEGVIGVRGRVVPVLSLRRRFGLPERDVHPDDVMVLAAVGEREVALRADAALSLARVDPSRVVPAGGVVARPGYAAGVAALPDGVVVIHDLGAFLSEAEGAALDAALSAGPAESPAP